MKGVGEFVADEMVGLFSRFRYRTGTPDIDYDQPVFDLPLPMIQYIITLPLHEMEDLYKIFMMGIS